ncbi:MAG: ORF6N domain-containing protein [Candidatus Melainabacteria bacterium]|nr:ORF6N domain-containing protein [Candidatus Melainabacteria bacterium]
MSHLIPPERIENKIFLIKGKRVMLDRDLAELYGVSTKRLNEQVKRNKDRFPEDFMFQLTREEAYISRSQIATLKHGQNIKYPPSAFTEQGVAMLSSVLNSKRAIQVNIQIMRTFTRLKEIIAGNKELAQKLTRLEKRIDNQDEEIKSIFDAIHKLINPTFDRPKRKIGFQVQ